MHQNIKNNKKIIIGIVFLLAVLIGYNIMSNKKAQRYKIEQVYIKMMHNVASQGSSITDTKGTVKNIGTFNTNRI